MEIVCTEDCGNAPKKHLLMELHIDYWRDGGQTIADNLTEDAVWRIVGGPRHEGKTAIREELAKNCGGGPTALHIHSIITHGNTAATNATVTMRDGSQLEYCNVYAFAGFGPKAKIKGITSYIIHVKSGEGRN